MELQLPKSTLNLLSSSSFVADFASNDGTDLSLLAESLLSFKIEYKNNSGLIFNVLTLKFAQAEENYTNIETLAKITKVRIHIHNRSGNIIDTLLYNANLVSVDIEGNYENNNPLTIISTYKIVKNK